MTALALPFPHIWLPKPLLSSRLITSLLVKSGLLRPKGILKPAGGGTPFTTGWKSAGAGANDGSVGDVTWANPGNITSSDNTHAESGDTLVDGQTTEILRATAFGFTTSDVPAGATILGIEVGIERFAEADDITDFLVRLRTSAGQTGDNKADTGTSWPSTDTEVIYGGSSDDWNAGLSDSDIRGSDFGVDLRAEESGGFDITFVDHIRIRVHGES